MMLLLGQKYIYGIDCSGEVVVVCSVNKEAVPEKLKSTHPEMPVCTAKVIALVLTKYPPNYTNMFSNSSAI